MKHRTFSFFLARLWCWQSVKGLLTSPLGIPVFAVMTIIASGVANAAPGDYCKYLLEQIRSGDAQLRNMREQDYWKQCAKETGPSSSTERQSETTGNQSTEKLACIQRAGNPYRTQRLHLLPVRNICQNKVEVHYNDGKVKRYVLLGPGEVYKLEGDGVYENALIPVLVGECIYLPTGSKKCNRL